MTSPRSTDRRRLAALLLRVFLAAGAVPLLIAPTCGTMAPGLKSFARRSLIIPMDVCYQNMSDDLRRDSASPPNGYVPASCPQAKDSGDVIRAYGLVYQLVRNNIAVYWIISPTKDDAKDIDLSIQYKGGPPAFLYDWPGGGASAATPTSGEKIDYRGGPFVVDGTDFDRAVAVLSQYRSTFQNVNVHVSNVAFQAEVAKTMAGGWSAGGTVPPKLALLNIGSDGAGAKNSEEVIRGYLERAGLNTPGAADDPVRGIHGQIYDRLEMEDFLPDTPGDWTTTNLYRNGYQILWVPHWIAPNSCSDCTGHLESTCPCDDKYPATDIAEALATIGAFHAAGKDVFAECAGLGSFEGVFGDQHDNYGTRYPNTTGWDSRYRSGHATTHFQTVAPTGFWINQWPEDSRDNDVPTQDATLRTGFSSPLMQIGDFDFVALSGAIGDYRANEYKAGITRFITYGPDPNYDIFTMLPPTGGRGTAVYLGGHSYSGTDGRFEVAGSRLVLNTLFNLGANCQETGVACSTGELGECSQGVMSCTALGQPYCRRVRDLAPTETCDGKDNNCNGLVDENLDVACYDGPPATRNVGTCQDGVSSCILRSGIYVMSECRNDVLPSSEICNGLDDDCDTRVDENAANDGQLETACYTGPVNSIDPGSGNPRGICKAGVSACQSGVWSACDTCPAGAFTDRGNPIYADCQILPMQQDCEDHPNLDMTCAGTINCSNCTNGATQPCYYGPPGTAGVGICQAGTRTCTGGDWGECNGGQTPLARDCSSHQDNDCNGALDDTEPECITCPALGTEPRICRVPGIARVGGSPTGAPVPGSICRDGVRACEEGVLGECSGMIFPSAELCDGKDNDCDAFTDEKLCSVSNAVCSTDADCPAGETCRDTLCGPDQTCVNGVCIQALCDEGDLCPYGYRCSGTACVLDDCGSGPPCPSGQACDYDYACVDRCAGVICGEGASCSNGLCNGGGCYLSGCPSGQACQQGNCVPDPCAGVACPVGAFCRAGDCVQSCVYVTCPSGQVCGMDGFCERDLCDGMNCSTPGTRCEDGDCVPDLCTTVTCGARQTCDDGICKDDPCNAARCPVGACSRGQCFPTMERDGSASSTKSSGGCGSGQPGALSALLLLALVPLLRRRAAPIRAQAHRSGRRAALLGVAALFALGAQGCKKGSSSVNLSECTHVCEGEDRCIDLAFDSGHCGGCDTVCSSGQMCRDGVCGPSSAVAPRISEISPTRANHGLLEPVTVTFTGERFKDGATVRVIAQGGSTTYPADVDDAGHLSAELDLSDVPITVLDLRVVNPDRVISNAVEFDVVSVAPNLVDVTPASVNTGSSTALHVTGAGFSSGSVCHMAASCHDVVNDFGLATASDGGGGLNCQLDAAGLPPRTYQIWVVNDGSVSSNCRELDVVSATPTLVSLSPSSGQTNSPVDIVINGTGFDATSAAHFTRSGVTKNPLTTYVDASRLFVSQLLLDADGGWTVTVTNGSRTSNSLTFTTLGNPPQVSGLNVYPTGSPGSPAYQGDAITLSFSGTSLTTANGITVLPPTGASWTATLGTVGAASVSGTTSLAGKPDGLYSAYLTFPSGNSSTLSFRVLSNVAVLRSVSPAGRKQGESFTATLTASNLHGSGTTNVVLRGPTGSASPVTRTTAASSAAGTTVMVNLNLVGLNTGVYGVSVQNPNAAASNEVSFSVLPGAPTLTAVTPSCVLQDSTPQKTITLTGANFALPDAQGNAVSQIMFSSDGTSWYSAPATVTATNHDSITATFDTRNAAIPPGVNYQDYQVSVWNPSATPPSPMKSASRTLRIASISCP